MRVQLCYRCRFCRQYETRDVPEQYAAGVDDYMLKNAPETIKHDCTPSGSHRGLCDLVGAVVTEGD